MYNEWNEGISAKLRFVRRRELYKSSKKLGLEIKKLIHFVKKFISLTVILMNIQYISTSTEHIYYISASTKLQPSVPRDYNARQMHRSNLRAIQETSKIGTIWFRKTKKIGTMFRFR